MTIIYRNAIVTPLLAAGIFLGSESALAQQLVSAGEFCMDLTPATNEPFIRTSNDVLVRIEAVAAASRTLTLHGILQITTQASLGINSVSSRIHFTGTSTAMTNVNDPTGPTVYSAVLHGISEITDFDASAAITGLHDAGNEIRTYTAQFAHTIPFDRNKSFFNDSLGGEYRINIDDCNDSKYAFYDFNDTKPFFK